MRKKKSYRLRPQSLAARAAALHRKTDYGGIMLLIGTAALLAAALYMGTLPDSSIYPMH